MNNYYRMFLIVALTLGMANASLSEEECVTLKCSDMQVSQSDVPSIPAGKKYQENRTITICPTQKQYFDWASSELSDVESVSDSEYILTAIVYGPRSTDLVTINRVSGLYTFFRARENGESVTVSGNCSEIELKPIPEDAGKPKF